MTEDEISLKVGTREFIDIEKIDRKDIKAKSNQMNQVNGFFTIGVITDKSPIITSKNGKKFSIFKLSDLAKYDLNKLGTQNT